MRRHPFFFRQAATGEVTKVLFHPDESDKVIGSKRFLASTHSLDVGSVVASGTGRRLSVGLNWTCKETDAVGVADVRYVVAGGTGFLRPRHVVRKLQRYHRSVAVPRGFSYEANTTTMLDPTARHLSVPAFRITHRSHFQAQLSEIAPKIGESPPELDGMHVLPLEPSMVTWKLTESRPPSRSSRRLSVGGLVGSGFVLGGLLHTHQKPPSSNEMRSRSAVSPSAAQPARALAHTPHSTHQEVPAAPSVLCFARHTSGLPPIALLPPPRPN